MVIYCVKCRNLAHVKVLQEIEKGAITLLMCECTQKHVVWTEYGTETWKKMKEKKK